MAEDQTTQDPQLWLDDFAPGQRYPGATHPLSVEHFRLFAEMTGDAHPIHYDPDYAARTRFGRPVAHGLLVAGFSALGASALSRQLERSMIAMMEVGFRYLRPVFSGDTLTSTFEIEAVERKPGADKGVLRFRVTLANQAGETVVEGRHAYLMRCRPAG